MIIRLVPLDATDSLPTIIVDRPILLIGRHPECDVQIRSSKVSRKHCCVAVIQEEPGQMALCVRDLDSTNGIRINGNLSVEGRLHEGDELTIGAFRFQVTLQPLQAGEPLVSCEFPIPILEAPYDHILDSPSGNSQGNQETIKK
ncbi:MAG TPA: FHA domain-containing protein [Gemmatales bacterium]|nr:FHA domain-containing protein [Gemmatales bacterium]HMP16583.1 FHA domain-containing protein [Gemmatales bacterium]